MIRLIRTLALTAPVILGLAFSSARGQTPNPNESGIPQTTTSDTGEGSSSGDPLWGYVGTGLLCAVAIFVITRSARR